MLYGRLVKSNDEGSFHMFFEQQLTLPMGPSSQFNGQDGKKSSLLGKVAAYGFGIVQDIQHVPASPTSKDPTQRDLRVVLRHTDYHNIVSFLSFPYSPHCKLLLTLPPDHCTAAKSQII